MKRAKLTSNTVQMLLIILVKEGSSYHLQHPIQQATQRTEIT